MENRINIAELLKDCQEGMELDCTIWDNDVKVFLKEVIITESSYPIIVTIKYNNIECTKSFTKYGAFNDLPYSKCVIFPKGKDTWEGFRRPFKDGDVVFSGFDLISIFKEQIGGRHGRLHSHVSLRNSCVLEINKDNWTLENIRFATEEERQKLFDAIKSNGYRWNAETKTLERLVKSYFKVGDVVQNVDSYKVKIIGIRIEDECYEYESVIAKGIGGIPFNEQDEWELVPDKFDINTLKTFESRVLVRDGEDQNWRPAIFGGFKKEIRIPYIAVGGSYFKYLIPYEGNEHLCLSKNDCDEFYKTWE